MLNIKEKTDQKTEAKIEQKAELKVKLKNDQGNDLSVVTGAFGYLGRYITRILLERGGRVKTLTSHPERDPFGGRVEAVPFNFDDPEALERELRGAKTVYNTYWIRFAYGGIDHDQAAKNLKTLIEASRRAGVERFVQVSITNPNEASRQPYFRGKALVERALTESGLSYGILRPTILFGKEDILINNIAWLLRRTPVYGVIGDGKYRVQPVYVGDAARLAVELAGMRENVIRDAVGPETYPFDELVRLIRRTVKSRALIVYIPAWLTLLTARALRPFVRDILITRDEIAKLTDESLVSNSPPTCPTLLSEWLAENSETLGREYASELARHYR